MPRRARLCLRPRLRAPRLRAAAPPLQAGDAPLRGARAMADAGPRTRLWRSGGPPALLARLRRDGFLLLRGLLPRGASCGARAAALEALRGGAAGPRAAAQLADPRPAAGGGHDDGEAAPGACAVGLLGCAAAAVLPAVASLLEHPALFALADLLLPPAASTTGGAVVTPAFKWLRAVAPGEFTGVHTDATYTAGCGAACLTFWLPLGDAAVASGTLLVARGSHRGAAFAGARRAAVRNARRLGPDGARSGWLATSAAALRPGGGGGGGGGGCGGTKRLRGGGRRAAEAPPAAVDWRCGRADAGDCVVLTSGVVHMSLRNVGTALRTSADTRWQRACDPRGDRMGAWRGLGGAAA